MLCSTCKSSPVLAVMLPPVNCKYHTVENNPNESCGKLIDHNNTLCEAHSLQHKSCERCGQVLPELMYACNDSKEAAVDEPKPDVQTCIGPGFDRPTCVPEGEGKRGRVVFIPLDALDPVTKGIMGQSVQNRYDEVSSSGCELAFVAYQVDVLPGEPITAEEERQAIVSLAQSTYAEYHGTRPALNFEVRRRRYTRDCVTLSAAAFGEVYALAPENHYGRYRLKRFLLRKLAKLAPSRRSTRFLRARVSIPGDEENYEKHVTVDLYWNKRTNKALAFYFEEGSM